MQEVRFSNLTLCICFWGGCLLDTCGRRAVVWVDSFYSLCSTLNFMATKLVEWFLIWFLLSCELWILQVLRKQTLLKVLLMQLVYVFFTIHHFGLILKNCHLFNVSLALLILSCMIQGRGYALVKDLILLSSLTFWASACIRVPSTDVLF